MKNSFESQINKLIKYIFDIGYFGTKLHPNRNHAGQYIEGEPFDYMIILPNYKACFDAKMSKGMRWRFEKKDIKQAENLKHCKNAGMDAFFLVYFSDYKRMVKYDVDLFLSVLAEGRKHLKITEGEEWDYKKCLEVKIHEKEKYDTIVALQQENKQLKKERDQAIRDIDKGNCRSCVYDGKKICYGNMHGKDREVAKEQGLPYCIGWQWRGLEGRE